MWICVGRMVYHAHLSWCSASKPFIYATPSCVCCIYLSSTFLSHLFTHSLLWLVPSISLFYSDGLLGHYTMQDVVCWPLLWTMHCCILTEEPYNNNRDSAYTDHFPVFVEGLHMVMLRTLLQMIIWPGEGGVENFGWMNVWVLDPEWPFYLGQRPLRPVGGEGTCWFGWWPHDWGERVGAMLWPLIVCWCHPYRGG
jgi:hypothetical protein